MTSERDTKKIEQLQRATCRQFQCLPERTAAVAIYTLIGAEPIETTLDKNAMILFKKGDPLVLDNYRPISLLNVDLKLLSYVLAQHLKKF